MPTLIIREPGLGPYSVPLERETRAGRFDSNDLVLRDFRVSRRHACFRQSKRGWEVDDLQSRHGTKVNGVRIDRQVLSEGDRIQLGSVVIDYFVGEGQAEILHGLSTAEGMAPSAEGAGDRRLKLLYEVTRAIKTTGGAEELLGRVLDAVLDLFGCERACVGLGPIEAGGLHQVPRFRSTVGHREIVFSRQVLDAVSRRQGNVFGPVNRSDGSRSSDSWRIQSTMCAPLDTGAKVLGILYVDDRQPGKFTLQDLDYLIAIGRLCAAALENVERYQELLALSPPMSGGAILGESERIQEVRKAVRKYAYAAGSHVLIRGETGTGKELVARALHTASPRSGKPFVAVNCAAIPETMIESELFGHVQGAFTGASRRRRGSFELADGGTLFLDEIGDLSLTAQAKVLRAIQEGEILPVGAEQVVRVDVRIVAATHKDLREEIRAGRFREDLYYRIAVLEILTPPLRERSEDVEGLAHALLRVVTSGMGKRLEGFTPEALAALRRYSWPGNVRELKNEVERAAINAESSWIELEDLSPRVRGVDSGGAQPAQAPPLSSQFAELENTERRLVEKALRKAKGNVTEAARLLGITRVMMKRRMERFELQDPTSLGDSDPHAASH